METGLYLAIVLIVLGIAFFFIFRQPIAGLIGRIRSISKSGIRADPSQKEGTPERDPQAEAEKLMRGLDSELLREIEELIRKELEKKSLLGTEAVPVLIRYLASLSIALGFEGLYRLIFGSQLNLLNYLNSQPDGEPAEMLRPFYTLAVTQYEDLYANYSFEQWLAFLKDSLLIREDGGRLRITVRGREFLAYLTRVGRSYNIAG